jgi:mannan endo-1,6-alpha-mannosidase
LQANDLELYNIRNDGWCLITLALILLSLTSAIPFSSPKTNLSNPSSSSKAVHSADAPRALQSGSANAVLPYARAIVTATVFHHLVTGVGAWQHYKLESHYNTAMGIGVWGNVWLVGAGVFTVVVAMTERGQEAGGEVEKKVR